MAGHVMQCRGRWFVALMVGAGLSTAGWAMGPGAPFVVPNVSGLSTETAAASMASGDMPEAGLSGVRVGRHAGAVIDGRWVRKGRTIRGAKLVEVQRSRVVLQHKDGRQEVLAMNTAVSPPVNTDTSAQQEVVKP